MFDIESLITSGGLVLIAFMVFAESGLLFGFFFPGDTLLLSAGVLAASGSLPLIPLIITVVISAILGGQVGYYIGEKAGPRLFNKKDGILFRPEYVERAELFYEKHGGKTIMFARFIAVVRTFAPVVAGIGHMDKKAFTFYNIVGSGVWGIGVTLLGYFFGSHIPNLDHYIVPVILFAMVISFAPTVYHIARDPKARKNLKKLFKKNSR